MVRGAKSGDGTVEGSEGTPRFDTIASQAFEFDVVVYSYYRYSSGDVNGMPQIFY